MKGLLPSKKESEGFTLIELMIVVAIVAILAAVGFPSYQEHMQKTRRSDGQAELLRVMNEQERYYTLNNTYVINLTTLGYASNPVESENGFYEISAAACGAGIDACVELTATALGSQVSDGDLELNSLGEKTPKEKW